jgi:type II secretory pathway pseudopilin PulG
MLIVIVIIGILIAALMPRMQAAQWRARDVSRKTALSQIQSAIVVSQWDKWEWPKQQSASAWIAVSEIKDELIAAWMNSIPMDPLKSKPTWLWSFSGNEAGDYWYIVTIRNGAQNWWFVLMAKTEVEWWSNWVVCSTGSNKDTLSWWKITSGTDLKTINLCQTVTKVTTTNTWCVSNTEKCFYNTDDELRYIVAY